MELAESERQFILLFRKHFGVTPNVFMYEFEELKIRLQAAEETIQQLMQGSLATAIKLEGVSTLLDAKAYVSQAELYQELDTYNTKRIEG